MAIKFLSGQTISGTLTVSGNIQAPTFNGLAINTTGTNNVANQIVRTQANGYANFGWINSVSGNHTGSITRITASNDAYLRYVTPAQFRTGVTDGFYAPSSTVSGVTSVSAGNGLAASTNPIISTGTLSTVHLPSFDTRSTNPDPEDYANLIRFDFKNNSTNGLYDGGTYNGQMTWRAYGSGADMSGGLPIRLAYTANGNLYRQMGTSATAWGDWNKFAIGTGTTSQYIRGDASLATFPTIPPDPTGVYLPLAGGTMTGSINLNGSEITNAGNIYNNGWFRNNNSGQGLYNQSTGNHWYSTGSYWDTGYNGTQGIRLRNGHNGAIMGYLYSETSGQFGLLDKDGNWTYRTDGATITELRCNNIVGFQMDASGNNTMPQNLQVTKSIYQNVGGTGGYIGKPYGADFFTAANAFTGSIEIRLPTGGTGYDDMIKFVVDIFDYATQECVMVLIGGYTYTNVGGGNTWYNVSAQVIGQSSNQNYTVRFGDNGSVHCVWIGDTTSTWNHPQIIVRDFFAGYNANINNWTGAWDITFVTSQTNINNTLTNNFPMSKGDVGGPYVPLAGGTMTGTLQINSNGSAQGNNLKIYSTTQHQYPQIYSDSTKEAMWNYKNDTAEWYVGIRNTTELLGGTSAFHFYNTNNSTVGGYDIAGNHYAKSSSRAPIFYDLNDTTYYGNFGATSSNSTAVSLKIRQTQVIGDSSVYNQNDGGWGARLIVSDNVHARIDCAQDANAVRASWFTHTGHLYSTFGTVTGHDMRLISHNATRQTLYNGYSQESGSYRAPIFYDSDNTTYYVDPNSTSIISSVRIGGTNHGLWSAGNTGQNQYYRGGGASTDAGISGFSGNNSHVWQLYGAGSNYGFLNANWASWDIRKTKNGNMYLNNQSTYYLNPSSISIFNDTRSNIYYDQANTGYYIDPASTSQLNVLNCAGTLTVTGAGGVIAPKFTDYNNGSFYLDPSSTGTSLNVAGDVVAYASSDIRFKNNITPITNALDKLSKIGGYTFEWNEISHKETGKKDIGVVAQEVEEILPEIVQTRSNGYKAVDYQKLTALLIESVKEQQVIINDLKTRIETLENN